MPEWGHIKISRKAYAKDPWWLEPRTFSKWEAWEDCIQLAAWHQTEMVSGTQRIPLARGEFVASIRWLAARWRWGIQNTRTYLKVAQQAARIVAQRETRLGTVYLLVNYEAYQGRGLTINTATNTVPRTANGKQPTQQLTQIRSSRSNKHKTTELTEDEQKVIEAYRRVHPKRLRGELPAKTLDLLREALRGYSVEDLDHAIQGNAGSAYHRENNFMDLSLVLRDAEHIDRYIALYEQSAITKDEPTLQFTN